MKLREILLKQHNSMPIKITLAHQKDTGAANYIEEKVAELSVEDGLNLKKNDFESIDFTCHFNSQSYKESLYLE